MVRPASHLSRFELFVFRGFVVSLAGFGFLCLLLLAFNSQLRTYVANTLHIYYPFTTQEVETDVFKLDTLQTKELPD